VAGGPGAGVTTATVAVLLAAAAAYVAAAVRGRRPWPVARTASWLAGLACVAGATTGPMRDMDLRVHMTGHLLLGMLAPLLLTLAAPVTLVLRTAPVRGARRLGRVLRTPPVRVLTDPFVATAVDVGGLVLLYRSPLVMDAMHAPVLGALVSLHVLLTGWLATAAVLAVDPAPHRRGVVARAAALALGMAVHDVLAKGLYAWPPAGSTHARAGAQLMYQGGTVVELAVAGLRWWQWYRSRDAVRAAEAALAG
jgi:putative membrane protein